MKWSKKPEKLNDLCSLTEEAPGKSPLPDGFSLQYEALLITSNAQPS